MTLIARSSVSGPGGADQESSKVIYGSVTKHRELLWKVNQKIFSNPELALKEFIAHDTLVSALEGQGIKVTPHAYDMQTSFEAEFGSGGRVLTYNAEYDALPGIGHACGHNLIATSSLGAFLGVVEALKRSRKPGRVRIMGTPAEEDIGGKIKLIEKGAYKDVDACIMMHPAPSSVWPDDVLGDAFDKSLAISGFKVTFQGKPAHAALAPWEGVNALDAAVAGYNNVSALRQQTRPDERIHVIIVEGGKATNIIPDKAVLEFGVRAPSMARTKALEKRIRNCCKGAAIAAGCEVEIEYLGSYADLRTNIPICQAFQDAMKELGHKVQNNVGRDTTPASTDQGNVSYECPSVQFVCGIPSNGAFPHTAKFADGAGSVVSFDRIMLSVEGMALTGYRFLTDDNLADEVKKYFEEQKVLD
ncbi:related to metal-dependent amidase/aminoacylase/carboxypeptidase [Phialocephala subalpina]|uniref:Peptidase M20 domain-containing protein 2 n=1 Tax=Phialocephala subalpina TaxID=576137 RepID=A0A1L7WG72_9HELO|nr:related to metal-dependent amidase/aminoacylase/carboxypeptidase [Phialocephala subalpina]